MKHNFKVGDEVITNEFESCTSNVGYVSDMEKYVGEKGVIAESLNDALLVHGYYWPASAITLVTKEQKFKIGDKVTNNEKLFNYLGSDDIIKSIVIKENGEQYCEVNNVFWPTSDLTLVTKEEEFKKGEEVEISNDGKIWGNSTRLYLCKTSDGLHAAEHKDGTICAFAYCRRPQPKMQKWNVWVRDGDLPGLLKEGYHFPNGTIVHTFEIPA